MRKIAISFVVLILLCNQLYGQTKNYNDKGGIKILAEKTILTVTAVDVKLKPDQQMAGLIAAAGTILPPAVDFVIKSIETKAAKDALAYQGQYLCSVSGEKFYRNNDFASLPKLTITRTIKTTDGIDLPAAEINLIPELSGDKTAFRYFVSDPIIYYYSIAKTKGKYNYIDVNMEIDFKSFSIDKEVYKINVLRTVTIDIPMVHVGFSEKIKDKIYSNWLPLPPRSTAKISIDSVTTKETKTVVKTNKSTIKDTNTEETINTDYDVNSYAKISDNTGLYEIDIKVIETNPYKIKAINKEGFIENTDDSASKLLKAIISSSLNK